MSKNNRPDLSSPLKRANWRDTVTENIVLDNIMQDFLDLRINYPRRLPHLSLLISIYTVRLFEKLVNRKFQEEVLL